MDKNRYSEWINSSFGMQYIEMLLLSEVQGLGILDVELLEELLQLKIGLQLPEDLSRIARYIVLSKLWIIGAYEIIRLVEKITKNKDVFKEKINKIFREALTLFTRIRVPLAKFEKRGKKEILYSGIANSFIDPVKGVGWKIYEHHKKELKEEIFYRKDFGDIFLNMLNNIRYLCKIGKE